jgi:2-oxo-4-hydroxy-4-carboxy--5-ureidoimidazoline (OHCU) decarboxylase
MTGGRFKMMNESEQRDLARKLCEGSDVFDFETALKLVRQRPEVARELLQRRAETKRRQEERAQGRERQRRALIEDYG